MRFLFVLASASRSCASLLWKGMTLLAPDANTWQTPNTYSTASVLFPPDSLKNYSAPKTSVCTLGVYNVPNHATVRTGLKWQKQSFKNWTACANFCRSPSAYALCSSLQLHDYLPFFHLGALVRAENKIRWLQCGPRARVSLEPRCWDRVPQPPSWPTPPSLRRRKVY